MSRHDQREVYRPESSLVAVVVSDDLGKIAIRDGSTQSWSQRWLTPEVAIEFGEALAAAGRMLQKSRSDD